MASIKLVAIEKWFDDTQVIKGIDLQISEGEFIVLVGPSGCGKSTLLRMLAGLEDTSSGNILINDEDVTDRLPSERGLSMVFQSYALYPHMDVAQNIGFALKTAGVGKQKIASRVKEVARILRLEPLLERFPRQLSGGQRQRVAIGRAIIREPKGFLFDEPLSNLDAALRVNMRLEISRLHKQLGITSIYVTHDQIEAMTLADRIVVLNEGQIMQAGSPRDLYNAPQNKFVAEFIGSPKMNMIPVSMAGNKLQFLSSSPQLTSIGPVSDEVAWLGVRPENIRLQKPGKTRVNGQLLVSEYLGAEQFAYVDCGFEEMLTVRLDPILELEPGAEVGLDLAPDYLHFFNKEGQRV
jgi:multiple sugar transport system ATP-binding protein